MKLFQLMITSAALLGLAGCSPSEIDTAYEDDAYEDSAVVVTTTDPVNPDWDEDNTDTTYQSAKPALQGDANDDIIDRQGPNEGDENDVTDSDSSQDDDVVKEIE